MRVLIRIKMSTTPNAKVYFFIILVVAFHGLFTTFFVPGLVIWSYNFEINLDLLLQTSHFFF